MYVTLGIDFQTDSLCTSMKLGQNSKFSCYSPIRLQTPRVYMQDQWCLMESYDGFLTYCEKKTIKAVSKMSKVLYAKQS